MRTLAEWVERFTRNTEDLAFERQEDGGRKIVKRELPALLWILERAVTSSSGGSGGGVNATSKMPLDGGALQIKTEIGLKMKSDLAYMHRASPALAPFTPLRDRMLAWHDAYAGELTRTESEKGAMVEQFAEWANRIEQLTEPPVTVLVDGACPICKQYRFVTRDEKGIEEEMHAVILTYQREEVIDTTEVICRACNEVLASGPGQVVDLVMRHGWQAPNIPKPPRKTATL